MTGMIEKVARAILHRHLAGLSDQYAEETWYAVAREERENSAAWRLAIVQARAALTALREPSADMGLAMLDQLEPGSMPRSMPVCRMFTAAINAALSEGEG